MAERADMLDATSGLRVFGTAEPPASSRRLTAGKLTVIIADGGVRGVFWKGVEVLRGVDYPVRNPDWGTHSAVASAETFEGDVTGFRYARQFSVADGLFDGDFECRGSAYGRLDLRLTLIARRPAEVNRAGFVVLHPIAGVAGSPLRVTHGDGSIEETTFPRLISPSQPVFDIAALHQSTNGVNAEMLFSGEVFEMEDQRNWSDASFKTYCRPLSLPYPYAVEAGETIEQGIAITLDGAGAATQVAEADVIRLGEVAGKMPDVLMALEAGWGGGGDLPELSGTLLRIDLTQADWQKGLSELLPSVRGDLDLEVVISDNGQGLAALRQALAGQLPPRIMALPKAYLKSYQPQALWPTGMTPEQAVATARAAFPESLIGGGVLTNFTELNRYRGVATAGDFITHGTTGIVHAADDVSVMQTLQALPQIFASAEALAPGKPYRLGLVSIGMRSNPYGADVADNPDNLRRPMAKADPRQRGLFGAAWMVGAMAATAGSRVESLALAAPAGPLGLGDGAGLYPVYHVFSALCCFAGLPRLAVEAPADIVVVAVRDGEAVGLVFANTSGKPKPVSLPAAGAIVLLQGDTASANWLQHAPRQAATQLLLEPYSVAFVSIGPRDFFGPRP